MIEKDFKSFRRDILKATAQKTDGMLLSYDDALEEVREYLQEKMSEERAEEIKLETSNTGEVIKDKEYLREKKKKHRELINECIGIKNIRVKGYEGDKIYQFIDEMVAEFAGYSILEEAFQDPGVSDIYVIDWDTIFVEKNGVNERYPHTFRSPKHCENVLKRFLGEAGKEINLGDSKIVDFELYQDRGAATSPAVSPRGYSMTLRKHSEDHITKDQLVEQNVMNDKIADLLGMLIIGETNLVCAGLTGSGKTTTLRALIDHNVTKVNKRMLVCEDTQELFPKNEHTLELVSVKSDDSRLAVSLRDLIFTALRLKPKYIIVGEVRGLEAEAAVEAMETGHSTMFTIHGGNPWNVINRIVTKYLMAMPTLGIDVVERIIGSGIDYIFIQDNIPGIGRRITSLTEVGYDFNTRRVTTKTIFRYDFEKKDWVWEGKLAEDKIDKMLRRGIPLEQLEPWMETK